MGLQGKNLSLNDSWGHDFLLSHAGLRQERIGLALTYVEIEPVTMEKLAAALALYPSEVPNFPVSNPTVLFGHAALSCLNRPSWLAGPSRGW